MAKETQKAAKALEATVEQLVAGREAEPKREKAPGKESVYMAGELAANARKLFGTRPECVMAALKAVGRRECTVSEAEGIVKKYLKKEVR